MTNDLRMQDRDTQLMLAFQAGDDRAFEALMKEYYPKVAGIVYRYTGSRDDADDMAQEAFIRIYRLKSNYRPQAKFSTWLYTIVSRLCLNELRNRKRRRQQGMSEEFEVEDKTSASAAPWEKAEGGELSRKIREALDALPENQRIAVVLSKWEGQSYEEVGEAMGMTVPAVKSLLFRARENLRSELSGHITS